MRIVNVARECALWCIAIAHSLALLLLYCVVLSHPKVLQLPRLYGTMLVPCISLARADLPAIHLLQGCSFVVVVIISSCLVLRRVGGFVLPFIVDFVSDCVNCLSSFYLSGVKVRIIGKIDRVIN